jgi:hypothetical protein
MRNLQASSVSPPSLFASYGGRQLEENWLTLYEIWSQEVVDVESIWRRCCNRFDVNASVLQAGAGCKDTDSLPLGALFCGVYGSMVRRKRTIGNAHRGQRPPNLISFFHQPRMCGTNHTTTLRYVSTGTRAKINPSVFVDLLLLFAERAAIGLIVSPGHLRHPQPFL